MFQYSKIQEIHFIWLFETLSKKYATFSNNENQTGQGVIISLIGNLVVLYLQISGIEISCYTYKPFIKIACTYFRDKEFNLVTYQVDI